MTLDQIEGAQAERRKGEWHQWTVPPSLQRAARKVGLNFEQCDQCRGAGYLKATLLDTLKQIRILAQSDPQGEPHIAYERCPRCDGAGGFVGRK